MLDVLRSVPRRASLGAWRARPLVLAQRRNLVALMARVTTDERIRGRKLQHIRREHFRLHPLCVRCEELDIVRLATELDHLVALTNGGEDVPSNRQGLCDEHHAIKTAADLGHKPTGCDACGLPTDPRHPWNRGSGRW